MRRETSVPHIMQLPNTLNERASERIENAARPKTFGTSLIAQKLI